MSWGHVQGLSGRPDSHAGLHVFTYERTNKVYLPMNGVNNDWLPVEAEDHQSWPPNNNKMLSYRRETALQRAL